MSRALRILSLNTWKNEGAYASRLELMAREISALNPDVLLLQECFRCEDTGEDTAAFLADILGLSLRYAPARRKKRNHRGAWRITESGLAILSRHVTSECVAIPLPSSEMGGERLTCACLLEFRSGPKLGLASVHFSHVRSEGSIRRRQIETTLEWMAQRNGGVSWIMGGDFNCEPRSQEPTMAMANGSLRIRNALPMLGIEKSTCPVPKREGRFGRQIDQIWIVDSSETEAVSLKRGGVCFDLPEKESRLYPSDHAGIWVDVEIDRD